MRSLFQTRYIPKDTVPVTREGINGIVYVNREKLTAIAYHGKANKPDWVYRFQLEVNMNAEIDRFFQGLKAHQEYKDKRNAERRSFKTTLKPGDILYTSWGYDQTNTEFFQVLSVSNNTVTIQEIGAKTIDATGPMSGTISPVKDSFHGPIMKKRVSSGNVVTIDKVRHAYPAGNMQTFHISWYH